MIIKLSINCVNGDNILYQSEEPDSAKYVLEFLKKYDHEGSTIGMILDCNDEETYKLLEYLSNEK